MHTYPMTALPGRELHQGETFPMPLFIYEARDASGKLVRQEIEAENLRKATQALMAQHMTVINIREKRAPGQGPGCGLAVLAVIASFFRAV